MELREFTAVDVEAAGELLARRHAEHRRAEPLLAATYEDPAVAAEQVAAAFAADDASGAVAVESGRLVGYLLGAPKPSPSWGPNVWVESAGLAVTSAELARDLYGLAAAGWVAQSRVAHYVLLPAYDRDLVDAFARLAFGQQHLHGIREPLRERPVLPPGMSVRAPRRDDIHELVVMDAMVPEHQARSPVFSAARPEPYDANVADWEELFDDPGFVNFVVEVDGVLVGEATGCSVEKSGAHLGPARPGSAGFLGFASVRPEARGTGVGRALGETVLHWAGEAGYASVVTDWRVTNLLSSRAWPRLGFRPTFVRMHRLVGY
jgi:GNAT superfamily N-acetyltransferase